MKAIPRWARWPTNGKAATSVPRWPFFDGRPQLLADLLLVADAARKEAHGCLAEFLGRGASCTQCLLRTGVVMDLLEHLEIVKIGVPATRYIGIREDCLPLGAPGG